MGAPALHDAVEDARAVMGLFVRVARPRLLLDAAAEAEGSGAPDGSGSAAFDRLVALQTAALLAAAKGQAERGGKGPGFACPQD